MRKAPEAFRTISEAAEALDTPAHVLRFWESKFSQVKPVKRAGGRRYYRPADIDLLSGIKVLLHEQGMTIRGVQKLLQEKGARHVAALAPLSGDVVEETTSPVLRLVPDSPKQALEPQIVELPLPVPDVVAEGISLPPESEEVEPQLPDTPEDAAPEKVDESAAEAEAATTDSPNNSDAADNPVTDNPEEIRPTPALAALLDAAAEGRTPARLRFAAIAHALRTSPPKAPHNHAKALARLETLVAKIGARAD